MEGLGIAASVIAVVELSAKIAPLCLEYAKDVRNAKDDIGRLYREVLNLENVSKNVNELLRGPNMSKLVASSHLLNAMRESESQLQMLHESLRFGRGGQALNRLRFRSLKWPFQTKDANRIIQNVGRCTQMIALALQVDQTAVLLDIDKKALLGRLPVVSGASFDSHAEEHNPTCLPNTRVDLLRQIFAWADDPSSRAVFWLNGMAGTGKSTISRTVAQTFARKGHLGGTFFFKRGETDRRSLSKFFSTIAADLVVRKPATACHVHRAIDAEPTILRKVMREQFDKLILQPLSMISSSLEEANSTIIIVDALDECERDDDIKLLIHLFSRANSLQSARLKIFLTSRPELPIRLGFAEIEGQYQDLILHEMPESVVEHDISAYLRHNLAEIRDSYNGSVPERRQLSTDWPGPAKVRSLVEMATPLFIFAATVCRFLATKQKNPDKQLREVLLFRTRSQESQLDATYLPVLNALLDGLSNKQQKETLQHFRDIVGSIIALASPLSTSALARLINIHIDDIDDLLGMLHSVLAIPLSAELPVRLLHLSFRDFLLDPEKCGENPFWIDERQAHMTVAFNCLRVMECLKTDICGTRTPGLHRSDISSQDISICLSPEVQYACFYWVHHVQEAGHHAVDTERLHGFLQRHFLHWMEALSLMGRVSESLGLIKSLQLLAKQQHNIELSEFLDDAIRFVLANVSAIDSTPLQITSSLLAFAPKRSKVRTTFEGEIPSWICLKPKVGSDWGQCLQALEGHSDWINSVAFSHDSSYVASASDDGTVRIWRADTGHCVQTLDDHGDRVNSVVFSHDSVLVASASDDRLVRISRADTGECVHTLEGHSDWVNSVAFSHDSSLAASASDDKTIRIWRTDTGDCIQTLEGHSDWVNSATFSHDSVRVTSASDDKTLRVWRVHTGKCELTLEGHESTITSVALAHDSTLIASASNDQTIRIWRADTGNCVRTIKGHSSFVIAVAFSHDSAHVVSASLDGTIRTWLADTGGCAQTLKSHGYSVRSIALSHDSTLIASASDDKAIRIWRADIGTSAPSSGGHCDSVRSIAFSHDSVLIASASDDQTIRVWRADTGDCIRILEGHGDWVRSVTFSHDSTLLASASDDNTIRIWRADTGDCVRIIEGCTDWARPATLSHSSVRRVAFSHDSALIASASDDKAIKVWSIDTGACQQTLVGHTDLINSVAFSHDSTLIASASSDAAVRIWRTDKGDCVQILRGHRDRVRAVSFSNDSALVASASTDKTVKVWHTETGQCIRDIGVGFESTRISFEPGSSQLLTDHGAVVIQEEVPGCLSVRPGGSRVAECRTVWSISKDRCWVTANGENLLWLPVEFRPFRWAVSGSTVVIGCSSGTLVVIVLSPPPPADAVVVRQAKASNT